MTNPTTPLPIYERIPRKNTIPRIVELTILFLLLSLLSYRIVTLKNHPGSTWLVALLCESWFTFLWVLTVNSKWSQVNYKAYPHRLLQWAPELPAVDMFVTTADPILDPPILTVNTVLSLLAVDYPAHKLACYVSDDGSSPLTYYSLLEASKFAQLWVPFCKKHNLQIRAPFRYFSLLKPSSSQDTTSEEFQQEWKIMKDKYEELCQKIDDASGRAVPCDLRGDFAAFSNIERTNHPTIIKVIWENKEGGNGVVPHLVYISREKRPKHPHHYKAGAMNVLARVSGVMTNAPIMMNVDCDMYVNDPQVVLRAMCMLLGVKSQSECAFVQFPQSFYDGLKDDPFGNQMVAMQEFFWPGLTGIQGPFYGGTGCFHRRSIIYGLSPDDKDFSVKMSDEELEQKYGNSKVMVESVAQILSGKGGEKYRPLDLWSSMEVAYHVANCGYEYGSNWGTSVGLIYGSTTEDVLTGLTIQGRGWRSVCCMPDPPAFMGCAPTGGPASMTQQKRWATGLLEILFSSKSPIVYTLKGKLQFRQCLAYLWIMVWGLRPIPEICYAALPAYCILTNSPFLPKAQEPAFFIPIAISIIYNLYTLYEYLHTGLSIRAWWNNQRMARVNSMCAWLLGALSVVLKLLGLSETVFEVTQKDQTTSGDDNDVNAGRFTFNESPVFVPGTTLLLVHLAALAIGLLGFRLTTGGGNGVGIGEYMCSVWVVLCFWAFLKGMFGKGKYGIPLSTILKSGALALVFVHFCNF